MNIIKDKELTMNKLTKIGASALFGSLAGISAANALQKSDKAARQCARIEF